MQLHQIFPQFDLTLVTYLEDIGQVVWSKERTISLCALVNILKIRYLFLKVG